jgi:hypothetical protein
MEAFVADADRAGETRNFPDFRETLKNVRLPAHANRQYFICKSVILNNLHGVDIMREAVEIAKPRLFLKLVSTVDPDRRKPNYGLEPLPDMDFNIRAGNTLVGFATKQELDDAFAAELDLTNQRAAIEEKCEMAARAFIRYKQIQLSGGNDESHASFKQAKDDLNARLRALNDELNKLLHKNNNLPFAKWLETHQPFHWFAEFYEIIAEKGGFDVIIGNPPYLDLMQLQNYTLRNYFTIDTRNLYPLVMERCMKSAASTQGYIVPVSSIATEGYVSIQNIILKKDLWISSFDDRPAHLFDGLDKNTLSILLIEKTEGNPTSYTSKSNRWNSIERESLFTRIEYQRTMAGKIRGCLPKIGLRSSLDILVKIFKKNIILSSSYDNNPSAQVFCSGKVNSFLKILDFIPEVRNGKGQLRPPSAFKIIYFSEKLHASAVLCVLNSSLFRWFVDIVSDGSHLNRREIDSFPFDPRFMDTNLISQLRHISERLSADMKKHSFFRTMVYPHDRLTVQCIIPKNSKPILDEIDTVLAAHYGFTEEELDYIINYDIKYRMGAALGEEEE